jgi:hypothetical protein
MTTEAPDGYTVRRFQPADAPGVTELVRRVYADTYVHPELYHPEELVLLNQTGENVSIVALDANGQVVGHYALLNHEHGPIAECGEAMVLPEHRAHHLLHRMRGVLEEEAVRLGLRGIFGQTVTVHVFSQKAVEAFGSIPCAMLLGLGPKSTKIGPEPLTQRLSAVLHFKYLQLPAAPLPVFAPEEHREMLGRIYRELGLEVEFRQGPAGTGPGELHAEFSPVTLAGTVRVDRVGADSAAAVARARRQLCEQSGAEVVHLDLPLSDPGTPDLCAAAESAGFFVTGLGPLFTRNGDTLRMQFVNVDLDLARLQIASPFARELLDYVAEQRQRVTGKS